MVVPFGFPRTLCTVHLGWHARGVRALQVCVLYALGGESSLQERLLKNKPDLHGGRAKQAMCSYFPLFLRQKRAETEGGLLPL